MKRHGRDHCLLLRFGLGQVPAEEVDFLRRWRGSRPRPLPVWQRRKRNDLHLGADRHAGRPRQLAHERRHAEFRLHQRFDIAALRLLVAANAKADPAVRVRRQHEQARLEDANDARGRRAGLRKHLRRVDLHSVRRRLRGTRREGGLPILRNGDMHLQHQRLRLVDPQSFLRLLRERRGGLRGQRTFPKRFFGDCVGDASRAAKAPRAATTKVTSTFCIRVHLVRAPSMRRHFRFASGSRAAQLGCLCCPLRAIADGNTEARVRGGALGAAPGQSSARLKGKRRAKRCRGTLVESSIFKREGPRQECYGMRALDAFFANFQYL
eukprot:scaffold264_cov317-Pinguiococcus_pyrenoidosus.AAC.20